MTAAIYQSRQKDCRATLIAMDGVYAEKAGALSVAMTVTFTIVDKGSHCEERSDVAISKHPNYWLKIAALRLLPRMACML